MEAPTPKINVSKSFDIITKQNQKYFCTLKVENSNFNFICDIKGKIYSEIKNYGEIKKECPIFDSYSIYEIFLELSEIIIQKKYEIIEENNIIKFSFILPTIKKNILNFNLTNKSNISKNENQNVELFDIFKSEIIKQKDEIIKNYLETIKQKDEIIKNNLETIRQKDEIIKNNLQTIKQKDEIIKQKDEIINNMKEKINENIIDMNTFSPDINFNFSTKNIKFKLTDNNSGVYCLIQLNDGRLVSGHNDGTILIYNSQTFNLENTIKKHSGTILSLIQLKDGHLISSSNTKINIFLLLENNQFELIQTIKSYCHHVKELINNQIVLFEENGIKFYFNEKNKFKNDYSISLKEYKIYDGIDTKNNYLAILTKNLNDLKKKSKKKLIKENFYEYINNLQFMDLQERNIKIHIPINENLIKDSLYMISKIYLVLCCINKIILIDIKKIQKFKEIEVNGFNNICSFCIIDEFNILSGDFQGTIKQWKYDDNYNLSLITKKEKSHDNRILSLIKLKNGSIVSSGFYLNDIEDDSSFDNSDSSDSDKKIMRKKRKDSSDSDEKTMKKKRKDSSDSNEKIMRKKRKDSSDSDEKIKKKKRKDSSDSDEKIKKKKRKDSSDDEDDSEKEKRDNSIKIW